MQCSFIVMCACVGNPKMYMSTNVKHALDERINIYLHLNKSYKKHINKFKHINDYKTLNFLICMYLKEDKRHFK